MQDTDKTTEGTDFEEAFDAIPEQVQTFLFSELFTAIINAIQQALTLTDEQKEWVEYLCYERVMDTMDDDAVFKYLTDRKVSPETAGKIIYAIDTEVVARAINITEFFTDDSDVTDEDIAEFQKAEEAKATAPNGLQSLADRLKQSSIATPLTRNYSLDKPTTAAAPETPVKRAIDPYHESIDNE